MPAPLQVGVVPVAPTRDVALAPPTKSPPAVAQLDVTTTLFAHVASPAKARIPPSLLPPSIRARFAPILGQPVERGRLIP
jgi:hypothetical protein